MISIRRLRRNVISNALGTIVPAVAWFIVVPILVLHLGDVNYGTYTIAISFAGVMGFLELGLTSAATKFIAEVDIRSDENKLEKIIANNLTIFVGLGLLIVFICFQFGDRLALLLFKDSSLSAQQLKYLVIWMGVVLSLTLIKNAFASVLMGLHRYDLYNGIQIGYAIALAAVQAALVLWNGQVVSLLAGNALVILTSLAAFALVIHRLIPGIHFMRRPDGVFLRTLFAFGMYMMVINLAGTLLFNVDKVIVGQVLGPASVAYYAIPSQITLKIHNGLAVFVSFLFPMASEIQSSGDKATLKNIFMQGMRFILLFDGAVMVFLAVFSQKILALWIDENFAFQSAPLLVITAIGYILYSLSIIPYHILLGIGKPRVLAVLNTLVTGAVILGLTLGLTWRGLAGGCAGVALGFCSAAILPAYVQRELGISWKEVFEQSYGRTILCTLIGSIACAFLPTGLVFRLVYFAAFLIVLIFFGNTRIEDWYLVKAQWQQLVHKVPLLRGQFVHRD